MHIDSASMKKIHKKAALQARKLTELSKKRLKTVIYMLQPVKNTFQSQKAAHSMNKKLFSLRELVHMANLFKFRYWVKRPPEQMELLVKKLNENHM